MSGLAGRDVVSIADLSVEEIQHILSVAATMVPAARGEEQRPLLQGRILAELFFEPSTRTRMSFESAMKRLGGQVINFGEISNTSVVKGETLADTVRMIESYSDALVVRHPNEGSARLAADFTDRPVINAGDGAGQHPTQTLLDIFTITQAKGKVAGTNVLILGDLKYGRTVHSLAVALSRFGASLTFVSPPSLEMPEEIVEACRAEYAGGNGGSVTLGTTLEDHIADADVLYVTRIQKERFPDPEEYRRVASTYRVDLELLSKAKGSCAVLHPLPRLDEIDPEIDQSGHALYFQQAFNGVPVRMALLALLLGALP